jgi:hypothetical protein
MFLIEQMSLAEASAQDYCTRDTHELLNFAYKSHKTSLEMFNAWGLSQVQSILEDMMTIFVFADW